MKLSIKLMLYVLCVTVFSSSYSQKQYIPLPDGSSVTIREGETPQQTWIRAQSMYPEAFRQKTIPENQKFDNDYFNDCKLKSTKDTKSDLALKVAIDSCKYKATPKKCRAFSITTDSIGNEKGDERIQCVEECNKANYYSKTVGECSKG
jgi:hypothetical protein